jgi:lysophospholipase L1-like esterase
MLMWLLSMVLRRSPKRVLIWGDSNSLRPDRRNCWPAILARKTKGRFRIINDSIEGRTTGFDANGLNSCLCLRARIKAHGLLDHVFVLLGTNDVENYYGPPQTSNIINNVIRITDMTFSLQKGVNLVFLLPPPIGSGLEGDFLGADKRVAQVCAGIQDLCVERQLPLIDANAILKVGKDLEADAIHLNDRGRQLVANAVYDYLV